MASNHSSNCARDVADWFICSGGTDAMSNSVAFIVTSVHLIMLTMWLASSAIDHDLSCGFHPSLSSGTRSSTRRVVAISWSTSGSSNSAIVISSYFLSLLQSTMASMNQRSVTRSRNTR